jgi:hypothetical protein
VEETFQTEKGLARLDEHQVRHHPSWARWATLAMPTHALLPVVGADEHAHRPTPDDLIPLSCNLPGPTGAADTRHDHAPVTTGDKPHPRHEDHDLQLEYYAVIEAGAITA